MPKLFQQRQANDPDEQRFWTDYIVSISGPNDYMLNNKVFSNLNDADYQRAELILLRHLPDWRAIVGLGMIRSKLAVGPLQLLGRTIEGGNLIRIEIALKEIGTESPDAGQRIASLLEQAVSTSGLIAERADRLVRMDAVIALREFPSLTISQSLQQAIANDSEYLVRYHALESLLLIYGYSWSEVMHQTRRLAPALHSFFGGNKKAEILHDIDMLIDSRMIGPAAKLNMMEIIKEDNDKLPGNSAV